MFNRLLLVFYQTAVRNIRCLSILNLFDMTLRLV